MDAASYKQKFHLMNPSSNLSKLFEKIMYSQIIEILSNKQKTDVRTETVLVYGEQLQQVSRRV